MMTKSNTNSDTTKYSEKNKRNKRQQQQENKLHPSHPSKSSFQPSLFTPHDDDQDKKRDRTSQ